MNVLLLGGGGREHALAWKLAQSPSLTTLWASPGNPGIATVIEEINSRLDRSAKVGKRGQCFNTDLAAHDNVIAFCQTYEIDLVVVGPEAPLVDGIADSLRAAGIVVLGPSRGAAQLEGSKRFAKALCSEFGIPTARYSSHDDHASARAAVTTFGYPVVVKADGLAAGKGVVIAMDEGHATATIDAMFAGALGCAGQSVIIEEFLTGEEVSLFALSDGRDVRTFGSAQDHKRIGEGDTGPNTGGMGAYSPATVLTPVLEARAMAEIVRPTIAAMEARGEPFVGVLYAGLMLTPDGPKLIEFNVRFGDPEAQAILPRFKGDLVVLLNAVADKSLAAQPPLRFVPDVTLAVVLAARGYPDAPTTGGRIDLPLSQEPQATIFIAGAGEEDGQLIASGGRVLAVTGMGQDLIVARDAAYRVILQIGYQDGVYRRDIGWRELERLGA